MSGAEIVQVIASVSELVRVSLRLYQFLNRLRKADANARDCFKRIKHLHEVVNGVELALESRKQQVELRECASRGGEIAVWRYIQTSTVRCHNILLQIRALYTAFGIERDPGLFEKAIRQIRLDVIKKDDLLEHYSALNIQIQALNLNTQTLNTFISIETCDDILKSKEEILAALVKLSEAHKKGNLRLETILKAPPPLRRLPPVEFIQPWSSQDAIIAHDDSIDDVKTMRNTLKAANDVITEYEPEPGSVMGRLENLTIEDVDSGIGSDEEAEADDSAPQPSHALRRSSERPSPRLRSGSTVQHVHETSRFVLDGYIRKYEQRVEHALEKGQVHTAEPDLRRLMEYAQERKENYKVDFNRVQMQEQLARIYKQQGKHVEVIAVLSELLPEKGARTKITLENSRHFQMIAETYYELWTTTEQPDDLEAACDHARTAFAIREKELDISDKLVQESAKTLADVYEELNCRPEAEVYREIVKARDPPEHPPKSPRSLAEEDSDVADLEGVIDVNEALIPTIKAANMERLRALLRSEEIDLELRSPHYWTPLMYAFKYSQGNESMPLALLDRGFDIAAYDNDGRTVLHHAAARADPAMIRLAIHRDAAKEEKDAEKLTPLLVAVKEGHRYKSTWDAAVEVLLNEQCDFTARDKELWTVIHHAAHNCATNHSPAAEEVLELLLQRAPQPRAIEARDKRGCTPLLCIAELGSAIAIGILLKHGADPNAINKAGRSALYLAMYNKPDLPKYANVIKLLVDAGATVSEADYSKEVLRKFRDALETGLQKRRASEHSRRLSSGKDSLRQVERVESLETVLSSGSGGSVSARTRKGTGTGENEANTKKPRRGMLKYLNRSSKVERGS